MIIDRRKIFCALRYFNLHTKYRTKKELLNMSDTDENTIRKYLFKIRDERESFFAKNYYLMLVTYINYYKMEKK